MDLYIKRPFHKPDFKIMGGDKDLVAALRLQYGKYIDNSPLNNTNEIDVAKLSGDILYEIDTIIYENTIFDESIIALHGSAVEWRGKAYLFLAATHSGKTTLTSYLTSAGFNYITDDCALIDRQNFMVHPYNCPVHLRDGGVNVLSSLNKLPPNIQLLDDKIMRRHIFTPDKCVTVPLPLGGVYFIERSETENSEVKLNNIEGIAELAKSHMTPFTPSTEYIGLLSRLSQTGCARLIYKDMGFVETIIRKAGDAV